jgi:hypothetical protein
MNWDGEPLPMDIFKVMISIPLKFDSGDLIEEKESNFQNEMYALKGVICFQGAHYFSFFRRTSVQLNCIGLSQETIKHELDPNAEWTLFDDDQIVTKGVWADVIK